MSATITRTTTFISQWLLFVFRAVAIAITIMTAVTTARAMAIDITTTMPVHHPQITPHCITLR